MHISRWRLRCFSKARAYLGLVLFLWCNTRAISKSDFHRQKDHSFLSVKRVGGPLSLYLCNYVRLIENAFMYNGNTSGRRCWKDMIQWTQRDQLFVLRFTITKIDFLWNCQAVNYWSQESRKNRQMPCALYSSIDSGFHFQKKGR